jgi:hypothetical protein
MYHNNHYYNNQNNVTQHTGNSKNYCIQYYDNQNNDTQHTDIKMASIRITMLSSTTIRITTLGIMAL